MEDLQSTPFRKRGDQSDAAARLQWRRLHPERRAPEADIHAATRGPYETAYDIRAGYPQDRRIVRP